MDIQKYLEEERQKEQAFKLRFATDRISLRHFKDEPSKRSRVWRVALIGALALVGCTSDPWGGSDKHASEEKGSATVGKQNHKEFGEASWYGPGFQGKETASGDTFNQNNMSAAHPSLPLGTKAEVTNLENGKKVKVEINDRGPYVGDRVIDLSGAAAKRLDMEHDGTTEVKIETKPIGQKATDGKSRR